MDFGEMSVVAQCRSAAARQYDEAVGAFPDAYVYHLQVGAGSLEDAVTLSFRSVVAMSDPMLSELMTELLVAVGVVAGLRGVGSGEAVPLSVVEVPPSGGPRVRFPLPDGDELESDVPAGLVSITGR